MSDSKLDKTTVLVVLQDSDIEHTAFLFTSVHLGLIRATLSECLLCPGSTDRIIGPEHAELITNRLIGRLNIISETCDLA